MTEGDRLVGMITLKDMLKFLSPKLDLRFEKAGLGMAGRGTPSRDTPSFTRHGTQS